jgi:hypothetical protein
MGIKNFKNNFANTSGITRFLTGKTISHSLHNLSAVVVEGGVSGGTVLTPGNGYKYHVFTSSGPLTVGGSPVTVDYLIVAGGGSGGAVPVATGTRGTPSSAFGIEAIGGGAGQGATGTVSPLAPGGSGGGGGGSTNGGAGTNYPGPTQQGFPGANGGSSPEWRGGGGGGAGGTGSGPFGEVGGIGVAAFSGDTGIPPSYGTPGPTAGRWFAGGGSGDGYPSFQAPAPAAGGGGAGGGSNGTANTGGGGGGNDPGGPERNGSGGGGAGGLLTGSTTITVGNNNIVVGAGAISITSGGSGGSGIVIIRYPT